MGNGGTEEELAREMCEKMADDGHEEAEKVLVQGMERDVELQSVQFVTISYNSYNSNFRSFINCTFLREARSEEDLGRCFKLCDAHARC